MTLSELNEQFGLAGILTFEEHGTLTRARVTLPNCEATLYLQGAHLTDWQPAGQKPVLFLSEKSSFEPGKAIRGGVPICFPWFGGRSDGGPGPSHGFARTQPWELAFAALMPESGGDDQLQMTFVLGPTELSRSLGFDNFHVAYEVLLGRTLSLKLTVANFGQSTLRFEEALHSYFCVGDVRHAALAGLESATFLDKRDEGRQKIEAAGPLQLSGWTDRVYPGDSAALSIRDEEQARVLHVSKQHSQTTVVWNPWSEGAAGLADLGDAEWPRFLCVEAANTAADAVTLQPGATHTMVVHVAVEPHPVAEHD